LVPEAGRRFRPDYVAPDRPRAEDRTFGFAPISVIQPVSRKRRSGHPISKDLGPEKLLHGEDFRAFDQSPLAGIGTDQAGADREGPAIDKNAR
jgi:hypothetical protein